jgi:FdhD protein
MAQALSYDSHRMHPSLVTPADPDPSTVQPVDVWRYPEQVSGDDAVAVEAPLEVRLHGEPFSVIMRTPGADRDLALGFLLTEGLLRHRDELARVDVLDAAHAVDVALVPARQHAAAVALARRRSVTTTSSCGLCGRASLASLTVDLPVCPHEWHVAAAVVGALPDALRRVQSAFARTGGLHAAALFATDGRLVASAEDVGRHNAVDKLLGRMLLAGALPLRDVLLMVSGRSSFEIVQKAWYGSVPFVAAVSAPSSLAVQLAHDAGITLLGFVRDGRFNVYAHAGRVTERQGIHS